MESVIIYRSYLTRISFALVLINLTICILLLPGMNLEFENPRYRRNAGASCLLSPRALECRTFSCGVCSSIWLLLPGLNGHGCSVEMYIPYAVAEPAYDVGRVSSLLFSWIIVYSCHHHVWNHELPPEA
jgi:hypothetical protein